MLHPDFARALAKARQRDFEEQAAQWRLCRLAKHHRRTKQPVNLREETYESVEHQPLRAA
jgi:hypothetical protein